MRRLSAKRFPEYLIAAFCVCMAGCSTGSRGKRDSVADWNTIASTNLPMEFEHVPEAPLIAPPPADAGRGAPKPHLPVKTETWVAVSRWSRENNLGSLQQISSGAGPGYSLSTTNGTLVFHAKSLVAKWNGQEFHLGFEPQMIGGQPFMHALDLEKNVRPLLHNFDVPGRTNRVIVIDPGHGGINAGTQSVLGDANEKDFTLDWALRLARLLATNGWQVVLTRTNDVDLSLSNRVAIAEQCKADLFLSLHFNSAAPNREQSGLETYCLTPAGMASTLTRGYEDNALLVFPNNSYDEANFSLAMDIQRSLLKEAAANDRGVRRARFLGVLRGQNRPAILIEGGYLSNPTEAKLIAQPEHRQKLAQAVAEVLTQKSSGVDQKNPATPLASDLQSPHPSTNTLTR